MSDLFSEQVFAVLESLAIKMGEAPVKYACRKFLHKKTVSGVKPTKRKPIPRTWVLDAIDRQDGYCKRCAKSLIYRMRLKDVVGNHRIPLAQGGHHNRWNIVAMHRKCNASKGANDPIRESKKGYGTILEQVS